MKLVIFAAGVGSRFGSLKQFAEIDEEHNFVLDYSLKEAYKAGFNDFLFVIRKETLDLFLNTIYKRTSVYAKVSYVFQDTLLTNMTLGTLNALLILKDFINEPFMVMNADDLYHFDAFKKGYDFLNSKGEIKNLYANVSYIAGNTIYSEKEVSRGLIEENDGFISSIKETKMKLINNELYCDGSVITKDVKVSMNLYCFTPDIFKCLSENGIKQEGILTNTINELIINKKIKVKLLLTNDKIRGLTFPEDLDTVLN